MEVSGRYWKSSNLPVLFFMNSFIKRASNTLCEIRSQFLEVNLYYVDLKGRFASQICANSSHCLSNLRSLRNIDRLPHILSIPHIYIFLIHPWSISAKSFFTQRSLFSSPAPDWPLPPKVCWLQWCGVTGRPAASPCALQSADVAAARSSGSPAASSCPERSRWWRSRSLNLATMRASFALPFALSGPLMTHCHKINVTTNSWICLIRVYGTPICIILAKPFKKYDHIIFHTVNVNSKKCCILNEPHSMQELSCWTRGIH